MTPESAKTILYVESNEDGTIGGSYYCMLYIISALDRRLYKPVALFEAPCRIASKFEDAGAKVIQLQPFIQSNSGTGLLRRLRQLRDVTWSMLRNPYVLARCLYILRQNNVRLIHLNNGVRGGWSWLIASKIFGIPCLTHQRDFDEERSRKVMFMARWFTAVICVSQAVKDFLQKLGIQHAPMYMIHDAIDLARMTSQRSAVEIQQELGVTNFTPVIGMVGNLQRWKGQWLLIEAVHKLQSEFPSLCCVMIGDVSKSPKHQRYVDELRASIAQYGLEQRVLLAGYRQDVPNYLNAFDIIVHASTNPEPFGLVVLEAMAFKKPLVASRDGGVREIVVEGNSGMLFDPGNADDLARALRELLKDKEAAKLMGENGHKRLVAEFTISTHIQRVQSVYEKVLPSVKA